MLMITRSSVLCLGIFFIIFGHLLKVPSFNNVGDGNHCLLLLLLLSRMNGNVNNKNEYRGLKEKKGKEPSLAVVRPISLVLLLCFFSHYRYKNLFRIQILKK
jgi:hypothetical protein